MKQAVLIVVYCTILAGMVSSSVSFGLESVSTLASVNSPNLEQSTISSRDNYYSVMGMRSGPSAPPQHHGLSHAAR